MKKLTIIPLLIGVFIGVILSLAFMHYRNNFTNKEEEKNEIFLAESYNPEYRTIKNDAELDSIAENSRYCWNTIKLVNGEVLTGSFGTDFDDGDYYLRKEDSLFIPKESVLYYK